jgi:multimeric flavodoxin WrbA
MQYNYSNLKAVYINCTLKPSPQVSNTAGLMEKSIAIMKKQGVAVEHIRAADYEIPQGVYPNMTEHGFTQDDWPQIFERIESADILVLGSPIWLGEKSSVCTKIIERIYGESGKTNDDGQYLFYGKVGGCIITGNEDGVKHCAMGILYALQHVGFVIPPQADSGWIGEAGLGPSYLDDDSGALENDFTNRNTTFMAWNLMHMANLLQKNGGIPAYGNQRSKWEAGCRFDFPNPEYR